MSLNTIMSASLSALRASEAGIKASSQNISNVDTPGYSRVELQVSARYVTGQGGGGVDVLGVRRAADRFLATAALSSESRLGAAEARADLLNRAQSEFGDPTSNTSTFAAIDRAFSSFTVAAGDPSSTLLRTRALSETQAMFDEFDRVRGEVGGLAIEANERIVDAVSRVDTLLGQVYDLNQEIQTARVSGSDSSAAENVQDQIAAELSTLLDVRLSPRALGGVDVRTADGEHLVGERLARVQFTRSPTDANTGTVEIVDSAGAIRPLRITAKGGSIGGLIDVRDRALPDIKATVEGLAALAAEAVNAAHNSNTATPAPATLRGLAPTGMTNADPLGFTGGVTLGLVSTQAGVTLGRLTQKIEINFSAGTVAVDGGAASAFTSIASLNTALGAAGADVTFALTGGELTIAATNPGEGVLITEGAGASGASNRDGRGFSHFFGLNDLVQQDANGAWKLAVTSPQGLALAQADLSVALGERALQSSDAKGATALAAARTQPRAIVAQGGLPATVEGLVSYASTVGGFAGQRASEADQALAAAKEFRTIAHERRDSAQQVNLDEELVSLTKYQQSYQAAARVLQTVTEMLDTLMQIR